MFGFDRPDQVHPVLSTACRNIESLAETLPDERNNSPLIRGTDHREKHDAAFFALKRSGVTARDAMTLHCIRSNFLSEPLPNFESLFLAQQGYDSDGAIPEIQVCN